MRINRAQLTREAAWSRNLQRLKEFLAGNPLVQSDINNPRNVKFLREYAQKHGLPTPESKDVSQMPAPSSGGVDYDKLSKEHPELLQEYAKYLEAKDAWLQTLPKEALPYVEPIFSGTLQDMINHQPGWSGMEGSSTTKRLQIALQWLQGKGIKTPAPFRWEQKYPEELLRPYRGVKKHEFINWEEYFKQHPELKDKYAQFQEETKGWEHRKRLKMGDPRDMLNEMSSPPAYESYIDRNNAPISHSDYVDYLWNLPKDHKDQVTPYFAGYDSPPNYGTDSEEYLNSDEPDHGDARAHVTPGDYGKGWMVHFSPAAEQIAKEGFQKGVTLQDADTLTQTEGGSGAQGFNYAFSEEHERPAWIQGGGKAVIFPGHYLNVYHERNEDSYVLFDGSEVPPEQVFPVVYEGEGRTGGWSVYDANNRKMIDRKPIKEVIEWVKANNGMLQNVKRKKAK